MEHQTNKDPRETSKFSDSMLVVLVRPVIHPIGILHSAKASTVLCIVSLFAQKKGRYAKENQINKDYIKAEFILIRFNPNLCIRDVFSSSCRFCIAICQGKFSPIRPNCCCRKMAKNCTQNLYINVNIIFHKFNAFVSNFLCRRCHLPY